MIATLFLNSLAACSKQESIAPHNFYSSKEAIKNGDIVIHGEISNIKRWDQFLKKVAKKQTDTIRITSYTNEGEPIFQDLTYNGDKQKIIYHLDNSHDSYAGRDKGIEKDECSRIKKRSNNEEQIAYYISGCSNNEEMLLMQVDK